MNSSARNKGFSTLVTGVVVVVIAAAGFAAWYVWDKNKQPAETTNNTNFQTNQTQKATNQDSEADKYLVIKEWNVRIETPKHLRGDVSYFMDTRITDRFGIPTPVGIVSKRFSAGTLKCAEIEGNVPRSIIRIDREIDGEGGETMDPAPFKRIGNARYYLGGTACEETIAREGSTADKQLHADLKTATTNTLEEN